MKRIISAVIGVLAIAATSVAAFASPPSVTGTWKVEQSGANGTTTATITLTQSGNGIVGNNPSNGNGYTGEFVNDTQINGKWHGPSGAGWLTVYVTPNGHSFNGTWGYNGRAANGSFVGNKVLPPSPLSAAGTWNVVGAGGSSAFVGKMICKQSGAGVVCLSNGVTLNGKVTSDPRKVRATFNLGGASGVFSFWFNGDNNSFNGVWWRNSSGTGDPTGRVVGQRALGG